MGLFKVNQTPFLQKDSQVDKNVFLTMPMEDAELPLYDNIKDRLPVPLWEGHEDAVNCYNKAWQLAFGNLRRPVPGTGFVSNFIDTAFNGFLFMWDSSFIVMFGKYASHIFNFQRTLDNMYSHQHKDGFICREICESENGEMWDHYNPSGTGPNIMGWSEWEYYLQTGDKERVAKVFDPLCAYHRWLMLNRSWPDGSYWSTGLGCGMDNLPRSDGKYDVGKNHGFLSWIDACAQQYLSAAVLIEMARILDREDEVDWLKEEHELLYKTVNDTMWSDSDGFYYDKQRDGTLSPVKGIGSYWTMLAGLVPEDRIDAFVSHLDCEKEFKRPNRIPSLSADHPLYDSNNGGYWKGGVWAPTNYMVLKGLEKYGYNRLAHEIAYDYVTNVVKVYNKTGTLYENYSPEGAEMGEARPDFVGWTGLAPISIMFEYVFGIRSDAHNKKITWYINLKEKHGIRGLRLGDAVVDLICEARESENDPPALSVKSSLPITVDVICGDHKVTLNVEEE